MGTFTLSEIWGAIIVPQDSDRYRFTEYHFTKGRVVTVKLIKETKE